MKNQSENISLQHKKTGESFSLTARIFQPKKDLEPLAAMLGEPSMPSESIKQTILKGYRRFSWGIFMVEDSSGNLAGTVQVGFYRPRLLLLALGRLPWKLPVWLCRLLNVTGIIRKFELSNIHIAPDWRGSGLAESLLDFAEKFGKQFWKAGSITLLVREENLPAVKLYEKSGYERTGIFRSGSIEKLVMTKHLSS